MSYYTERHGMRQPIAKTYDITRDSYALLLNCCKKYYNNLAWKYPKECADGYGCCGLDCELFEQDMKYEIPTIFRNDNGDGYIDVPSCRYNLFSSESTEDEYDQFALLDYIEFFAENCRDVEQRDYHSFYRHYHLKLKTTHWVFSNFQKDINDIFKKTGLQYKLTDEHIIERIVENDVLTTDIEKKVAQIKEVGTKELLEEAILLYKEPRPQSHKAAVEKIWDAFERLKTYYTSLNKKDSAEKIVNDMAKGRSDFITLFNDEFTALTKIGNSYRIRHHETNKINIVDDRYYDYFFNRCLSLIALAIQYLI